jgi:hypothetical protein
MLKRYKGTNKQLNTTINTFGFGYAIDTPMLVGIATEGHGMHSFIPDASFVGTAFINCISNLLVSLPPSFLPLLLSVLVYVSHLRKFSLPPPPFDCSVFSLVKNLNSLLGNHG